MTEQLKDLRELGYRYVTRLDDEHIILASLPDLPNYALFRRTDKAEYDDIPNVRGVHYRFVRLLSPTHNPELYFIADYQDRARKLKKGRKGGEERD